MRGELSLEGAGFLRGICFGYWQALRKAFCLLNGLYTMGYGVLRKARYRENFDILFHDFRIHLTCDIIIVSTSKSQLRSEARERHNFECEVHSEGVGYLGRRPSTFERAS